MLQYFLFVAAAAVKQLSQCGALKSFTRKTADSKSLKIPFARGPQHLVDDNKRPFSVLRSFAGFQITDRQNVDIRIQKCRHSFQPTLT
jgi:hypothetical protein